MSALASANDDAFAEMLWEQTPDLPTDLHASAVLAAAWLDGWISGLTFSIQRLAGSADNALLVRYRFNTVLSLLSRMPLSVFFTALPQIPAEDRAARPLHLETQVTTYDITRMTRRIVEDEDEPAQQPERVQRLGPGIRPAPPARPAPPIPPAMPARRTTPPSPAAQEQPAERASRLGLLQRRTPGQPMDRVAADEPATDAQEMPAAQAAETAPEEERPF